jgi:hypothetical protein
MPGDSWGATMGASPRFNTNRPAEWTRIGLEAEARSRPAPMRRSLRATLWTLWSTAVTIYVRVSEALRWVGRCIATSWRILLILTFLTVATPIMLFTSPLTMSFLQLMLGCGLAAATWVIVKHPTEKAQERMTSDRVQPEMHLVLGTLLPELAVNLERLLLWVDLAMRGHSLPVYLRYPVLNLVAYLTGPLWFALLMMAMVFLLLVVSVISFGFMIPWVVPVLGLLLGYALLVPVWVISVYTLSFLPLLLATFVGSSREAYVAYLEYLEHARARKMVRPASRPQQIRAAATSSSASRSWYSFRDAGLRRGFTSSSSPSAAANAVDSASSAPLAATGLLLCLYLYIYSYIHIYVYTYKLYVCMYTYIRTYIHTYIHIYIHIYIYIYMYVYICMYVCMYVCICVCMCVCE